MITGANTGFGRQIVKAPASSSNAYDITVAGRSLDKVQAAFDSAKDEFSSTQSKFHPLQVDIESDESINAAFGIVQSQFSCVDVSINNASTTQKFISCLLFANVDPNRRRFVRQSSQDEPTRDWLKAWNYNIRS